MRDETKTSKKLSSFIERYVIILVMISTLADIAITVYYLSQGTTIVFQNIYYFTIVLASYWYKWRGVAFSSALSATYLGLSAYYYPQTDPLLQAIIRSIIFVLISVVVACLSTRLVNERKRYQSIFSKSESGMVTVLTDDQTIKEANRRFLEITGEDMIKGKRLETFFKKEDFEKLNESIMSSVDFSELEVKVPSRSGEERTCLVSGSHLGPHEVVISLMDVTDRHLVERALRESEVKFREIFNTANDAIYLSELDTDLADGLIIDVNEAAHLMLGYSNDEFLRMTPRDLVVKQPQTESRETLQGVVKKGVGTFEEVHRRRDGSVIPVEINAHLVNIGGHQMVLAVVRDISDRKRAEEERRLNEETMRLVVASAPFPLLITNWDGTYILDANSKALEAFGLEIEQGLQLADLFVKETELESVMNILASQGSVDSMDVSLRGKGGERRWHMLSARSITYPGEQRLLLATYDVTERRTMERSLHEANLKLGILNSITRHDILNQMTVLNGFIELGKLKEKDPQLVSYFDKMYRASHNVQSQIAFTKDYQDMGVKAPIWVSPGRQATEALSMLRPTGVMFEDAAGSVEVLADRLAEKVPYNLIDNSIRHGEGVTHIKMSAERAGEDMLIVYQDDGMGITDTVREHLFEKGFGKNTGLGLFLVREILAITGITITENGQAGAGVRFEMLVPAGAWRYSPINDMEMTENYSRNKGQNLTQ